MQYKGIAQSLDTTFYLTSTSRDCNTRQKSFTFIKFLCMINKNQKQELSPSIQDILLKLDSNDTDKQNRAEVCNTFIVRYVTEQPSMMSNVEIAADKQQLIKNEAVHKKNPSSEQIKYILSPPNQNLQASHPNNLTCSRCCQHFRQNKQIYLPSCSNNQELMAIVSMKTIKKQQFLETVYKMIRYGGGTILFDCEVIDKRLWPRGCFLTQNEKHQIRKEISQLSQYISTISKDLITIKFVPIAKDPNSKYSKLQARFIQDLWITRIVVKPHQGQYYPLKSATREDDYICGKQNYEDQRVDLVQFQYKYKNACIMATKEQFISTIKAVFVSMGYQVAIHHIATSKLFASKFIIYHEQPIEQFVKQSKLLSFYSQNLQLIPIQQQIQLQESQDYPNLFSISSLANAISNFVWDIKVVVEQQTVKIKSKIVRYVKTKYNYSNALLYWIVVLVAKYLDYHENNEPLFVSKLPQQDEQSDLEVQSEGKTSKSKKVDKVQKNAKKKEKKQQSNRQIQSTVEQDESFQQHVLLQIETYSYLPRAELNTSS